MADRLYLSLWYPNFRQESLPGALSGVLRQFAMVGGRRVAAASAYPIDFTQAPIYQRIYADGGAQAGQSTPAESDPGATSALIDQAVTEATEQLHDDMAYEFEMRWQLWELVETESEPGDDFALDDEPLNAEALAEEEPSVFDLETAWRLRPHTVRVLGFGPNFDVAGYEQNGHILVDFGLDTPWTLLADEDDGELDDETQPHVQQNIEKLLAFTLLVEKHCGISSRLLWTESGEPLAEKLIAQLQRVN